MTREITISRSAVAEGAGNFQPEIAEKGFKVLCGGQLCGPFRCRCAVNRKAVSAEAFFE